MMVIYLFFLANFVISTCLNQEQKWTKTVILGLKNLVVLKYFLGETFQNKVKVKVCYNSVTMQFYPFHGTISGHTLRSVILKQYILVA